MKLTLVVPCFNEEESVIEFYSEVTRVFNDKVEDYELVFVNDGSRDKTPQILRAIYEKADNVKVINFSRNFGKEAAIYAGLKQSSGDYTCVIDADLQQRPEVVLEMKQILDENADIDCVAAYQGERKESKLLIFFKDKFYEIINKLSDVELYPGASDFRLMRRQMLDSVLEISILKYNDENSLACVLSLAYYAAKKTHEIYRELAGGKGFADLVFVPRKHVESHAMIVELKWDQSAQTALDQIREKKYDKTLKGYHGSMLLVGINYRKAEKTYTCKIETETINE